MDFVLPIGARSARFNGTLVKIIGAVTRSVTIEGIKYFWNEYLLYNPTLGFRWLVESDNHWNYVEPINPAEVQMVDGMRPSVNYNGKKLSYFSRHVSGDG